MIILTDIHGNFDTMIALLKKIPQEEKDKGIAIDGDLIDRGPKSMQIVQYCIDNNIVVVRGNHEQMMIDWEDNGRKFRFGDVWLGNGGDHCLLSYSKSSDPNDTDWHLFESHVKWMKELPFILEYPDIKNKDGRYLVLTHSNVGEVYDLDPTDSYFQQTVTWGRDQTKTDVPEIYNVIGHTPQSYGPRVEKHFANIDTGCFYKRTGYGKLTALQFPEMIIYEQENIDK